MILALILGACFLAGVVYSSFFEWTLHRFVMHRPILGFTYPFRAHGIVHHTTFGSGEDYHLLDESSRSLVTMAWWNAPVLLLINGPVSLLAAHLAGTWWAIAPFMGAMTLYYAAFEYFHYCMHVPGPRWFQSTRLFKWLDLHHRLHHFQPNRNLNVVCPIADFVFRSRLARAPQESA